MRFFDRSGGRKQVASWQRKACILNRPYIKIQKPSKRLLGFLCFISSLNQKTEVSLELSRKLRLIALENSLGRNPRNEVSDQMDVPARDTRSGENDGKTRPRLSYCCAVSDNGEESCKMNPVRVQARFLTVYRGVFSFGKSIPGAPAWTYERRCATVCLSAGDREKHLYRI